MTDMLLYRLNRVPDKNYVKFLELIGVRLQPARPATADVTFRLTTPTNEERTIPRGTEVGTVRTETQESVTFATDRDLVISVPQLEHVLACRQGDRFLDYRPAAEQPGHGLGIFSDVPQEDDALYLGFSNDLRAHTLVIRLRCRIEGIGVDPDDPPLAWECWDGLESQWVRLARVRDTTGGLNRDGMVILDTPPTAAPRAVDETGPKTAFWVRCRVLRPRQGQGTYSDSPRLTAMPVVESMGGLVPATHAFKVVGEELGTSDGTPGQRFRLQTLPVLPRLDGETLEVETEREDGTIVFEPWVEVPSFGASDEDDPHFVVDDVPGTV
jgi:predicted phage baseplate assembly protein